MMKPKRPKMTARLAYKLRRERREAKWTYEDLEHQNSKGTWLAKLLGITGGVICRS